MPVVETLAGTPKGRLTKLEKDLATKDWQQVKDDVQVKLLHCDGELYVLARSLPRRHEGQYLLRSNLTGEDPAELWRNYINLVRIEESFRTLKGDLGLRPVFHQLDGRQRDFRPHAGTRLRAFSESFKMRYRDSIEDRVHQMLSTRLKHMSQSLRPDPGYPRSRMDRRRSRRREQGPRDHRCRP
jgi:hypothetical protein